MELSEPLENYLKEIYEIELLKGYARVSDLILAFNVSPGTVSKALEKLEKIGLIERDNKKIKLTTEGKKIAEKLIRAHRLSERLLTDIIGLDWIRAHQLAHRLEHIWPEDVVDKIDELLGKPLTCPHGHPIPGREVKINGIKLSEAECNKKYKVIMIIREEEWILSMADELNIKPGVEIKLIKKSDNDFVIEIDSKKESIPKALAEEVLVSE
ncbi:metal-dependent transcriptional regulator [Sulfurisphaera ohwakuensis]|uniref:DtxR family Mn-dependent transcriptional regulator n=1 Tax=Sulfurisphaera ohwakuensis TaxID=69656 RepID=A0A650CJ30_SULOH|nr:metal-dependent transcriptional regulator [Sulfurisphaera ohwakuensis]MBB5253353.1 DtxR family Mn-dependent transcriptional regulator [Sulfurisphaera ohwakuensis]QGR17675.1 MarR family transcriptional regulator [Sulfurisphaera ohwakuensis]